MKPIPLILHCPKCEHQHVDEGEWATKPHKTHLCAFCKHEWRPSDEPTVGVAPDSDEAMRALWRSAGGDFHGPNVEHGYMTEVKLLPFLRKLVKPANDHEAILKLAIDACQTNLGKWAYKDEVILAKLLRAAQAAHKKLTTL